jgi:putative ABC transport system substrate-binding protein
MNRREFITGIGGCMIAGPPAAHAAMPCVAVLMPYAENDSLAQTWLKAFVQAMQAVGWTEGRNVRVDVRWAGGMVDRIQKVAKELVDLKPQVVFAMTTPSVSAVRNESRTIPIVFTQVTDPVAQGLVESAREVVSLASRFSNPKSVVNWCRYSKRLRLRRCAPRLSSTRTRLLITNYT